MKKFVTLFLILLFGGVISSCKKGQSDFELFAKEYKNYFPSGYDPHLKWYEFDYLINYYNSNYSKTKTVARSLICQVDFEKNSWNGQLKRYFMTTTTTEIAADEVINYKYVKCYNDKFLDTKNYEYYYYVKTMDKEASYGLKEVNFLEVLRLPLNAEIFNPQVIYKKFEKKEDYLDLRVGSGYVSLTKILEEENYFVEIKENYFYDEQAVLTRVEISRLGEAKSLEYDFYSEYLKLKIIERDDLFSDPGTRLLFDLPLSDYPIDDLNMVKKV